MDVIRRLGLRDAEAWRELRLRMLREEPTAFGSSYEEEQGRDLDAVRVRHFGPDTWLYGAFAADALVGAAGMFRPPQRKRRHVAEVWGMYVAPEARRRGLGRALLEHLLAEARAHEEIDVVALGLNAANAGARSLYLALGFAPWGIERDALRVDGVSLDEERMSLRLS